MATILSEREAKISKKFTHAKLIYTLPGKQTK